MTNVSSSNSLGERVPKLRFPEFEGEWDSELFSDLFTFLSNNTLSRAELSETGNIRNIHYGDILVKYTDVINVDDEIIPFVSNDSEGKVRCDMLRTGDVIIADTAEDDAVGKATEIISHNNKPIVSGLHTVPCRPNRDFTSSFLGYYINSNVYHLQLYPYMQGIKVTSISKANIGKTIIHFPSRSEQKKIVELFNLIEKKILIQKKLLTCLKLYKRGAIDAIYNQKICLKDKNGLSYPKWLKTTIGELFDKRNERALGGEDLLAVTINNGVQKKENIDGKDISSNDKSNYKRVLINDIAYNTMRMWQGASGVSQYCGIVSPAYTVITPKDRLLVDSNFYAYYFKLPSMVNMFEKYSQGLTSDTWNLKYQQLSHIPIFLPSLEEQKRIVSFLSNFDICIKKEKDTLSQMTNIKKYLLQQMFI